MDRNTEQRFRALLETQRQELEELDEIGNEAAETVELDQSRVGRLSRMDALQGQAMSQERKLRRQQELTRIAGALRRMEEGEYGYCLRCGEEIASKRLEFDPAASLCIECASKSE